MGCDYENDKRNSNRRRDNRSAAIRKPADNMPRVQPFTAKEKRPVLVGFIHAGRDRLALLALFIFGRFVL